MVEEVEFIFKEISYLSGQEDIFIGGVGSSFGAVMGEEEHFCVVGVQELFEFFDIESDLIGDTDGKHGAGGDFSRSADTECAESSDGIAFEEVFQVSAERFKIVCLNGYKALFFGAAEDLSQKDKVFGALYAHAFHAAERIDIGGKYGVQIAESVQQILCGITGVGAGNDVEKQHFENFKIGEAAEVGVFYETFAHTLAVSAVP